MSKIVKKNLSFESILFTNKTMGLVGIGGGQGCGQIKTPAG
jgi:hypothetical protein